MMRDEISEVTEGQEINIPVDDNTMDTPVPDTQSPAGENEPPTKRSKMMIKVEVLSEDENTVTFDTGLRDGQNRRMTAVVAKRLVS